MTAKAVGVLRHDEITRFKLTQTNENQLIGLSIRGLLNAVNATGPILDVGAGAGDIAEIAFPNVKATLIDLLPFAPAKSPLHTRIVQDYFGFDPEGVVYETVIMSHVLQYLDHDVARLTERLRLIAPRYLVTVTNLHSEVLERSLDWLEGRGVEANPEVALSVFPPSEFQPLILSDLTGRFWADNHAELARLIGDLILDARLDDVTVQHFSAWLRSELPECRFSLEQRIQLYVRS